MELADSRAVRFFALGIFAVDASVIAIILAMASIVFVAILGQRSSPFKRAYYLGIAFWSRWLPVVAAAVYLGILASNVAQGGASPFYIVMPFSFVEQVMLFMIGPLFLTRMGNILATAALIFTFQRVILHGHIDANAATFLFMAAMTIVAVLGDKMPWIPSSVAGAASIRLRESMLTVLTLAALGVLVATIVRIYEFNRWISEVIDLELSVYITIGLAALVFMGWLIVAMGSSRTITLPLLSLPTTLALAFISGWDTYMLVIPFSMCLAFSLSSAERRTAVRRVPSTYRPGIYAYGR